MDGSRSIHHEGKMGMAKQELNMGQSLLQNNPARDALLEKMRDKLARNIPIAQIRETERQKMKQKATANWTLRIMIGMLFLGANFFFFGKKETLMAHIGYQAVPPLPKPNRALSIDEQALYWTYALYDFKKLKGQFGIEGLVAIDQNSAKQKLETLLPMVSKPTIGIISAYTHVAFRDMKSGGSDHE
jgi:hypothetical protein